ncbi:hypothetical protein Ahy_B06g081558 [Arachis hypogaea]|uniref:PB1-like domain-containing protein n=1 Tax=Arachis hypogaea TaxID=3818 RepID=A0A444YLB3_ARAHY|nr:hypothetical protein Ahy_B06g081558 [Arachis hypogaea]
MSPPAAAIVLLLTVSVLVVKPASVIVIIDSDRGCRRRHPPRSSSPLRHENGCSIIFKRVFSSVNLCPRASPWNLCSMDAMLDIIFHHRKNFEKAEDERLGYYPDNKHCLGEVVVDRLDVFYMRNYFKELGYDKVKEVWWLVPGRSLEVGLRCLISDYEIREMCSFDE